MQEQRYLVYTRCADWSKCSEPPYSWELEELRKAYRRADATERARIVKAGKAIRAAQAQWPAHAVKHVQRVFEMDDQRPRQTTDKRPAPFRLALVAGLGG